MFGLSKTKVATSVAIFAAAIAFNLLSLAVAAPTYAQSPSPQPNARQASLARQFKREQTWFNLQQGHLTVENQIATAVQNYINAQNALGKDTSTLVAALATYNSQIATAQNSHNTAGNLISAHAGFDANGNVTNVSQALQTVIDSRQSLWDAHRSIQQATQDLARAIRAYRQANPNS